MTSSVSALNDFIANTDMKTIFLNKWGGFDGFEKGDNVKDALMQMMARIEKTMQRGYVFQKHLNFMRHMLSHVMEAEYRFSIEGAYKDQRIVAAGSSRAPFPHEADQAFDKIAHWAFSAFWVDVEAADELLDELSKTRKASKTAHTPGLYAKTMDDLQDFLTRWKPVCDALYEMKNCLHQRRQKQAA